MKVESKQISDILNMLVGSDLNFIIQFSHTKPAAMAKFIDCLKMTIISFLDKQMDEELSLDDKVTRMQFLHQELWSMCNDYKCARAVRFMENNTAPMIVKPKPGEVLQFKKENKKNA